MAMQSLIICATTYKHTHLLHLELLLLKRKLLLQELLLLQGPLLLLHGVWRHTLLLPLNLLLHLLQKQLLGGHLLRRKLWRARHGLPPLHGLPPHGTPPGGVERRRVEERS